MKTTKDALNSAPHNQQTLVHYPMRKVLMHNYQLIDRYVFSPLPATFDAHACGY